MSHWITGKVVGHQHWNAYLHTLFIEADIGQYEAGQFVKIGLPFANGHIVGHPYSLVNAPGKHPLEILYIEVPEGELSPKLVKLQPGDTVQVSPNANGFMILDEVPPSEQLWLIATGTGVGPFLAMLDTEKIWLRHDQVILVYAARLAQDLAYLERIRAIGDAHPGKFTFVPFVSREAVDYALEGRIPDAIQDGRLEAKAGMVFAPETSQFILCGNPSMITDVSQGLQARGFKKHRRRDPGHITTETYW